MEKLEESLLEAWLRLSTSISNERIVSDMPYNESLICNILYRSQLQDPKRRLTATDLCRDTKILKSQMNRTLNSMEAKNLIIRERSPHDKRKVYILLNPEQARTYKKQHLKILRIINELVAKIGKEKAEDALELFNLIADTAKEVIK